MHAAAVLGRIVNVGRLGGVKGEFDFDLHAMRRIDYIGVTFRTRSSRRCARSIAACGPTCGPHVEAGKLRLPIDRTFPLAEAAPRWRTCSANSTSARSC